MPLSTNFNVTPYYDDYDEAKNYYRILFRPGYAVQAREVTQLQTVLQKQIESSENRLDRKLVNHYIDSGEILDSETLLETIGFDRVKKIIVNIFKKSRNQSYCYKS